MYYNSNVNKTNHRLIVSLPFVNNIFENAESFFERANSIFQYQRKTNKVYQKWCEAFNSEKNSIGSLTDFSFLPISFFKTHEIKCGEFEPQVVFESSGTAQQLHSHHYVKDVNIYNKSFLKCFENFYGDVKNLCILGLLPSYLERKNSSLVMMADELIKQSAHLQSGFYLYDFEKLSNVLKDLENAKQQTLLIGVTFALLDFAEQFPVQLKYTTVMETGGMKGRREELTRQQVHEMLCEKFGLNAVHSEYGMTELLSQAYSKGNGRFFCAPWMKVLVRDEDDPLLVKTVGRGALNIIDLANVYSCSFIATDDTGYVYEDGSFGVWGRLDNSDVRGCSLMTV
ncbi:MAG: acyl transferase [Parafilimonas sp.]